jgi:hypothetical protein
MFFLGVPQDVPIDPVNLHPSFCAVEAADVSIDSCGVVVSPGTRKILRTTPSFPGGSTRTWAEIRGGQSSPEVIDGRAFAGSWNNMTFAIWNRGIMRAQILSYSHESQHRTTRYFVNGR